MIDRSSFLLDPQIVFLNHGSFGACPKELLEEQRLWIERLERQPVLFFRETPQLMLWARRSLADFVGASAEDLVYVSNSTYGVSVLAHAAASLLNPGDEVLMTDHEYGACERAWDIVCEKRGAQIVKAQIPIPMPSQQDCLEAIWSGVTPNTKIIFVSHITSPTALRLPVAELCVRARAQGLLVFVDGSHVPGHIPLDLATLGAHAYTANCHKWMCTPKGSAFLWVDSELHARMSPLVVSWGSKIPTVGDGPFVDDHEYLGTRDISPFLTVPRAITWMNEQPWTNVQSYARALCAETSRGLLEIPGIKPLVDGGHDSELQMVAVQLPDNTDVIDMKEWFYNERAIEVVVHRWLDMAILRCSFHAHSLPHYPQTLISATNEYLLERSSL